MGRVDRRSTPVKLRILYSAAVVIAFVLLFAVPFQLKFEPLMAVASCAGLLLAIWIPVSSRFFGAFSLAWTASIAFIVLRKGFAMHSYDVMTDSGVPFELFKTSGFQRLQGNEWFAFAFWSIGAIILLFIGVQALIGKVGRIEDNGSGQTDFPALCSRLFMAWLIASVAGVAAGWFRAHNGFFPVLQGLAVGFFFAYAIARVMRPDPEGAWTFDRRQIMLLVVGGSFLAAEALVVELLYRSFRHISWFTGIVSGEIYEHIFGIKRGYPSGFHARISTGWWLLFNMLDIVFQVFISTLMFAWGGKNRETLVDR